MKKSHLFVLIIFSCVSYVFIYSFVSGGFVSGIQQREDNIKLYDGIVKIMKSLKIDYQVLSGRRGGLFTFEIDFKDGSEIEEIESYFTSIGFKKVNMPYYVYCDDLRGVRVVDKNKKIILEYERTLSECFYK